MAGRFARVRERNQITVPPEVAERLAVRPGDIVEFSFSPAGTVELRPAKIVTRGTPEALQEEEAAKEDIRQGRYSVIGNVDEFQQHVERVRKGDYPSANQSASKAVPVAALPIRELLEEGADFNGIHFGRRANDEAEDAVRDSGPNVPDSVAKAALTGPQRQEVEAIVEAVVKKFQSDATGSGSILRGHAQNRVEQR